ncbi:MAG TPA: hemolysin family protein [Opitutaceae bacterium]|nr:hemolysin family protein [Opitutaceae bacterium]
MNVVDWFVILVLILVNALYVAAEFAAVGVRRGQIRERAQAGSRFAVGLLVILEDSHKLDRYIAACQIGITFSSLVLGAFGQFAVALDLGNWLKEIGWEPVAAVSTAAVSVLVFLTILQVVLGELVPKSLALQFATQTALVTYLPMVWSLSLFRWFIAVLNGSGLAIVRLFGGQPGAHRHIHSPEEIDMLLAESADGGLLEPEEQKRLHDAIRLSGRTARELMTPRPRVRMINGDADFPSIISAVVSSPFTRLPVYRDDAENVVGFVHTRDLAAHVAQGKEPALEAVLRPILAVARTTPIHQLLPQLRRRGQRIAIVVDEFGSVAGVVTLQDVLDELLGVPTGAHELPGQSLPEKLPDGRWRIPGLLPLTDLYRVLGVDWRDRQVTTIGGLILKQFAHMPKPGEKVAIRGVEIEVERVERQTIVSVLVAPPRDVFEGGEED